MSEGASQAITISVSEADVFVGYRGASGFTAAIIVASPENGLKPTSFKALTLKLYKIPVSKF